MHEFLHWNDTVLERMGHFKHTGRDKFVDWEEVYFVALILTIWHAMTTYGITLVPVIDRQIGGNNKSWIDQNYCIDLFLRGRYLVPVESTRKLPTEYSTKITTNECFKFYFWLLSMSYISEIKNFRSKSLLLTDIVNLFKIICYLHKMSLRLNILWFAMLFK